MNALDNMNGTKTSEDLWFCMEEIPRSTPLMIFAPGQAFVDMTKFGIKQGCDKGIFLFHEGTSDLIFPRSTFTKSAQEILNKLLDNYSWGKEFNDLIISRSNDYFAFAKKVREINLAKLSDKELADVYEELHKFQYVCHSTGVVWVNLEFDHQLFTKYLIAYIEQKIKKKELNLKASEVFSTLTTPTKESFAQKEEKSLLALAVKVQEDEDLWHFFIRNSIEEIEKKLPVDFPEINFMLEKHVYNFQWLPFMYLGPTWNKKYFLQTLKGIVTQNSDVKGFLQKYSKQNSELEKKQKELLEKIGVHGKHLTLFNVAKGMVFTKAYRKDALYFGMFVLDKILTELCKRKQLSKKQAQYLYPFEIPKILKGETSINSNELNQRFKYHVLYAFVGGYKILLGKEAKDFMSEIKMESTKIDVEKIQNLLGDCACPGIVRGVVKIIESPVDMIKMNEGNILVAHATNPDIVPAMKKSGAIVTDLGGITCHAAIVSRELGKPCVIGTKHATKVLKDGMTVEVDATHAIVRILDRDAE